MSPPAPSPSLPKIDVMKEGQYWRVDWDYQVAPESRVLFEKSTFLDGYVCGLLDSLGASAGTVCCASARTGTVKKLNEEAAHKLAELLKNLLHSHVEAEHSRLVKEANLPHVKLLIKNLEVNT